MKPKKDMLISSLYKNLPEIRPMNKRSAAVVLIVAFASAIALSGCGQDARKVSSPVETSGLSESSGDYSGGLVEGIVMDNDAAVVTDSTADLFIEPDVKSERVTQALYNQPVRILEEKGPWTKVAAVDGSKGWLKSKAIDRNKASIYGGGFSRRLVVTSRDKPVSAYSSGGMTLKNVTMGTELYSFNQDGDAFEVYLPGNRTGWLKGSGMINLDINEEIPVTGPRDFVSTAMKFKGTSFLLRGVGAQGIDSAGLVYISARVNGVKLPRTLEGQLYSGTEIRLEDAEEGDLIFVAPKGDKKSISSVGICTGSGSYILAGRNTGYVAIMSMNEENSDGRPVMARRIFRK